MSGNKFLDTFIGTTNFVYDKKYFVAVLETFTKELKGILVFEGKVCIVNLDDPISPAPGLNINWIHSLEDVVKKFLKEGKGGILVNDVCGQNFTNLRINRAFVTFSIISGIQKVMEDEDSSGDTRVILGCDIFTNSQNPPRLRINLPFEEFLSKLSDCSVDKIYIFRRIHVEPRERIEVSTLDIPEFLS